MRRALVTGGAGLVGWFIARRLVSEGWEVAVSGQTPPPEAMFGDAVRFHRLPLAPETDFGPALAGTELLVHCAFQHEPGRYRGGEGGDPPGFRRANLEGSVALFAAAKAAGVARAVFLSSRAAYGRYPAGTVLREEMAADPDTLYGEVKLAAERALAALAGPGFSGVSLRATGVYGPAPPGRRHKWAGLFEDYLAGRKIAPRAGTEVHGQDLADAVLRVAEAPGEAVTGKIFNVSDILLDRRDLLTLVARETGCAHTLPETADTASLTPMDTARLRALGWSPGGRPRLEATVRELLRAR